LFAFVYVGRLTTIASIDARDSSTCRNVNVVHVWFLIRCGFRRFVSTYDRTNDFLTRKMRDDRNEIVRTDEHGGWVVGGEKSRTSVGFSRNRFPDARHFVLAYLPESFRNEYVAGVVSRKFSTRVFQAPNAWLHIHRPPPGNARQSFKRTVEIAPGEIRKCIHSSPDRNAYLPLTGYIMSRSEEICQI